MHFDRPVPPRTTKATVRFGSSLSPPVTSLAAALPAALVAEPASRQQGCCRCYCCCSIGKLPHLCKEEPPAQAGGFLFRTAMLRNRLVRFLAGPPHTPRGKYPVSIGARCTVMECRRAYENDYIADLSMQSDRTELLSTTTLHVVPRMRFDSLGAGSREFNRRRDAMNLLDHSP